MGVLVLVWEKPLGIGAETRAGEVSGYIKSVVGDSGPLSILP